MSDKLLINLLPLELRTKSKASRKKILIVQISVAVLILFVLITAGIFAWSLYLRTTLIKSEQKYNDLKSQIESKKDKEIAVFILKNRLDSINKIIQENNAQIQSFNLISNLQPPDLKVLNFNVDKTGSIKLSATTQSFESMQTFFNNLSDPEKNEGKISSTKVQSLNKNPASGYNFDLVISGNKEPQKDQKTKNGN